MLTPLIVTGLLAAATASPTVGVDAMNNHPARALEEGVYLHVVALPFKGRVERKAKAELLEIDVIRFGPATGPREGAAAILVELGGQTSTLPIRAPLEPARSVGDGLIASYPVRHRFSLPEGVSDVVITVVQGSSGVGLQLRTTKEPRSGEPPLLPLEPLEPAEPEAPLGASAAESEPEAPAAEPPPPAAPIAPVTPPPAAALPAPLAAPPLADVVQAPPVDGGEGVKTSAHARLPARFSAQVGVGGMLQLVGGLAPAVVSGGVRVVAGARAGWLSRYAFGAALDFEHQAARTTGDGAVDARWNATATRFRLEGQADLLELDLGFAPLDVTLLGGAGMVLGAHTFEVDGVLENSLLLGPTFRVGAQAGLRVGPGAIVALVPVDLSIDAVAGRVRGFAPLATSLYVGYRLDL